MKLVDANTNVTSSPDTQLCVTVTAAAGAIATLTLPAVTGQFHYISKILITKFANAALTPAATPVSVTTTNLPGTPSFDFAQDAGTQGTLVPLELNFAGMPFKSSVAGVATTIVGPATTALIWRITVFYTTAG